MRLGAKIEKASDYCTFCPKLCRFACPVAAAEKRETVTPWGLMSLLHMARHDRVELNPEVAEIFYHCTGCLRCQTFCRHDNDVAEAMMAARRTLVDQGVALPSAMQGMDLRYEQHGSPMGAVPELPDAVAAAFDPESAVAYVPEATRRGVAGELETLAALGRVLEIALGEKVALIEDVDGQPLHDSGELLRWSGHVAWSDMWQENMVKALDDKRLIITEAAGFVERWHRSSTDGPRVAHLTEILVEHAAALSEAASAVDSPLEGKRVVYHDACSVGRRLGLFDGPRVLVEALLKRPFEELWLNREEAVCCGAGAHYPTTDPAGAASAAEILAEHVRDHGADVVITADQGCRYHMLRSTGIAVLDIIELARLALGIAP